MTEPLDHVRGYYAALDNGRLPIVKGLAMTRDDRIRGEIIQRLMCTGRLVFGDIERRYGLHGQDVATLEELAGELDVTRERVRQIQAEALEKLRSRLARRGMEREDLL